jgi:hypothetical protein
MTINIRQEKTIKATEVTSTTQYMAGSDIGKREVVGISKSLAGFAEGWYSNLWRVRWSR